MLFVGDNMINILFSGIDKENGFTNKQAEVLKKDLTDDMSITFVSSIFNNYERSNAQFTRYLNCFKKIGITFSSSYIIDNRMNISEACEKVANSDIVFLLSGSPELQMKSIIEYNLTDLISKSKIIIGVSAGSMNQSKIVMYRDDFDNNTMKKYYGLNLIDINIFPHVSFENKKLLEEAKEISEYMPLILLQNESFIRINNGLMDVFGKYYILNNRILIKK